MSKIKIFGDSTCDLPEEILKSYDLAVMPLPVIKGEESMLDGVDIVPDDIYAYYETTGKLCKTAAPGMHDYLEFWKPWVEQGYDIIHFHISAEISGAYNFARLAANELGHVYPVDSRVLSTGIGLLMLEASDLRAEGRTAEEIVDVIEQRKNNYQTSFLVDVVEYLWKGGRCSSVAALGANVLKLKPRIDLADGKMISTKKYRGKTEKCFEKYADDLLKDKTNISPKYIFVTHSGIDESIIQLAVNKIKEYQPQIEHIFITRAGCTISCHCGPGTLGILYLTSSNKS